MTTQKNFDVRKIEITQNGKGCGVNAAQKIETHISSIAHFINNNESKKFINSEYEKFFDFINFLINETK